MAEKNSKNLYAMNARMNDEKQQASFLGFLQGVMCCGRVQPNEMDALKARAEQFLKSYHGKNSELVGDALDILENAAGDWENLHEFQSDHVEEILELQTERLNLGSFRNELNMLEGFLLGIATDGQISTREAEICRIKITNCQNKGEKEYIYKELLDIINIHLTDGVIDQGDSAEISDYISRIVGDSFSDTGLISPSDIKPKYDFERQFNHNDYKGKSFVLTGEFSGEKYNGQKVIRRRDLEKILVEKGLVAQQRVNGSLDILFISNDVSPHYATETAGNKIIHARKLIDQGIEIKLVSETLMWRSIIEN